MNALMLKPSDTLSNLCASQYSVRTVVYSQAIRILLGLFIELINGTCSSDSIIFQSHSADSQTV